MTADQPRDAAIEQDIELRDDRTPLPGKPWLVRLTCCGRADGVYAALTWEEADRFRLSYTAPGHYEDVSGLGGGHRRSAVIEDGYAPALAARPDSPTLDVAARAYREAHDLLAVTHTSAQRTVVIERLNDLAKAALAARVHNIAQRVRADDSHDQRWLDRIAAIEAEAYEQGRKAGLTEAIEAVEGLPGYDRWLDTTEPDMPYLDRAVVIDTLTRLRDGS